MCVTFSICVYMGHSVKFCTLMASLCFLHWLLKGLETCPWSGSCREGFGCGLVLPFMTVQSQAEPQNNWELHRNANYLAPPRPTDSGILGVGPRNCLNKPRGRCSYHHRLPLTFLSFPCQGLHREDTGCTDSSGLGRMPSTEQDAMGTQTKVSFLPAEHLPSLSRRDTLGHNVLRAHIRSPSLSVPSSGVKPNWAPILGVGL